MRARSRLRAFGLLRPGVRRQLAELLAADPELAWLERPVFELLGTEAPDAAAGEQIGPYRLERELGCGGIGAVFLAARADGAPGPKFAIKVLKRGMDSDEILRRFGKERQILARLDHPNVVRFHDGGCSEDQRPYLVMEHVDGVPIDRFCARAGLDTRARIELFLKVCAGVQLAHQSLVATAISNRATSWSPPRASPRSSISASPSCSTPRARARPP